MHSLLTRTLNVSTLDSDSNLQHGHTFANDIYKNL